MQFSQYQSEIYFIILQLSPKWSVSYSIMRKKAPELLAFKGNDQQGNNNKCTYNRQAIALIKTFL